METTATDRDPAGETRSTRKRRAILEAARTAFLRHGYGNASMDEIAALAKVSKQTVYKHFADKQGLLTEVIVGAIGETEQRSAATVAALPEAEDFPEALRQFARQHVKEVLQPHLVQMRRILISEADRFPELARTWYATGPERAYSTLAELFGELARRGRLRVDDPLLAAQHFNWLTLSVPLNKMMFCGSEESFADSELEHYADAGVRVFLAAYGPDSADV